MINYEVNHQLMINLKAMLNVLHQNKQNLFSSAKVCVVLNGLNTCRPISPKPQIKENKKIIKGELVKEVKNDKK